ncbi:hypothetical protein AVEN_152960-1 [Araneus ventricosus]|uniref:Reverse transcriptase domain-containing protein n=1 Tax=Araneus ventricosus TaxID=182803 RepID=A0A4Y2ADT1_ARAVE|nr:hypothetical protein AVEN_152960-1 [Araneus ventricosus]
MISLIIKGAFDHLQYTSIKNSLDNLKYHSNTLETLIDILSNSGNKYLTRPSNMESATRMLPRLLHRPSFQEPGGRRSAPTRLAPKGAPAGICR